MVDLLSGGKQVGDQLSMTTLLKAKSLKVFIYVILLDHIFSQ